MMSQLLTAEALAAFATLAALEIVLGIDNLMFVQIVASRCKPEQQDSARRWGLMLALLTRLGLLYLAFGGVRPGDYRANLIYNKNRTFAFVMAFGPVSDEWYANAAGAIN